MADARFREARWRRAGAADEQLDELRARHAEMSGDEQAAEGERVDSVSDDDLAAELAVGEQNPAAGRMDEVLARVGDDAEVAAVVRSHEAAKKRPRQRLLDALDAVIAGGDG